MPTPQAPAYDPANDLPYHEAVSVLILETWSGNLTSACNFIVTAPCPTGHDYVIATLRARKKSLESDGTIEGVALDEVKKNIDKAIAALQAKKAAAELKEPKKRLWLRNWRAFFTITP